MSDEPNATTCSRCKQQLDLQNRHLFKQKMYCTPCFDAVSEQAERDRARSRADDAPGTPWD